MPAYSIEAMLCEDQAEVNELFEFVKHNAEAMDPYGMEQAIFSRMMRIGLAAMKGYFAKKSTGDIGDVLELTDGRSLKEESRLKGRMAAPCHYGLPGYMACYSIGGSATGGVPWDSLGAWSGRQTVIQGHVHT